MFAFVFISQYCFTRSFLVYISDIVAEGLAKSIVASLTQLHSQVSNDVRQLVSHREWIPKKLSLLQIDMDDNRGSHVIPLLEIQLDLADSKIVWIPELHASCSAHSVCNLMHSWMKGCHGIGLLIRRLDCGEGEYHQCSW